MSILDNYADRGLKIVIDECPECGYPYVEKKKLLDVTRYKCPKCGWTELE